MRNVASKLIVAAAATAALAVPAPAVAGTWSTRDARHDVSRLNLNVCANHPGRHCVAQPSPHTRLADITRLRATYRPHALLLTVGLRSLDLASPRGGTTIFWTVRTPSGDLGSVQLTVSGSAIFAFINSPSGHRVSCAGLSATSSGRHRSVTVSVPAHCVGTPRWVRIGASSVVAQYSRHRQVVFADDALRRRPANILVRHTPRLGPRIYRG